MVLGPLRILAPHSAMSPHRVLGLHRALDPHRVLVPIGSWVLGSLKVLGLVFLVCLSTHLLMHIK